MAAAVKSKSVMESSSEAMAYDDRLLWGRLWIFFQDMHDEGLISDAEEEYLSDCVDGQDPADPMLAVFLRTGANSFRFLELAMPLLREKGVLEEDFDRFCEGGGYAAAQQRQEATLLSSDEEDVYGDRERPGNETEKVVRKGGGRGGPQQDGEDLTDEERRWRERGGLDADKLGVLDAAILGPGGVGGVGFNPRRVGDMDELASAPVPPARRSRKPNVMELTPEQINLPGGNHALWLEEATACSVVSSVTGTAQVDACVTMSYQVTPHGSPEPVDPPPVRKRGDSDGDEPEPPAPPRGVPRGGAKAADAGWNKTMSNRDLPPPPATAPTPSPQRSSLPRLSASPAKVHQFAVAPGTLQGDAGSGLQQAHAVQHGFVPTPPQPGHLLSAGMPPPYAPNSMTAEAQQPPSGIVLPHSATTTISLPLTAASSGALPTQPPPRAAAASGAMARVEQWRNSNSMAPDRLDGGLVSGLQQHHQGAGHSLPLDATPLHHSEQSAASPGQLTPAYSQVSTPRSDLYVWTPQQRSAQQALPEAPGLQLRPVPQLVRTYQAVRGEEEEPAVGEA
mmetsp:Transcript_32987/g.80418  ORF Transcript_32987/g.80418 Transcript_32987/m.80418 type:complete len:564 (-) Transcript_32987:26-1717(-)|eukprot:CAMPEP_0114133176 /NCGR_PEP_ID=MMETSP0043_2-20121206/13486_1 /TAXON_ID=464988 /ORGANISM="Hemiselmis andersenii, Strain CCMP644" /LENGTH=563 /DNA_ID=CAMNT_0001226735 /DNA_START=230 /DNA_END=1921 /DNA_ORIENTATION=+